MFAKYAESLQYLAVNWCLTIISAHSAFDKLALGEELLNLLSALH